MTLTTRPKASWLKSSILRGRVVNPLNMVSAAAYSNAGDDKRSSLHLQSMPSADGKLSRGQWIDTNFQACFRNNRSTYSHDISSLYKMEYKLLLHLIFIAFCSYKSSENTIYSTFTWRFVVRNTGPLQQADPNPLQRKHRCNGYQTLPKKILHLLVWNTYQ